MPASEQELSIGLIGAGRIGQVHARSIGAIPGVRLAMVCDADAARAGTLAAAHDAAVVTDPADVMASDVDAVVIASPTATHVELLASAITAGKPVLCEKPIDLDLRRVDTIRELAAGSPAPVMLGFNRRFDPQFAEVRERVAAGEIGEPEQVTIVSRDPAPPGGDYLAVSGGIFRDMTIHDFDMARFLVGEIAEVSALGSALFDDDARRLGDLDTAVVTLRSRTGATVSITNSRHSAAGHDQRLEVFGGGGALRAENLTSSLVQRDGPSITSARGPLLEFFFDRYRDAYRAELQAFLSAVGGRGRAEPGFEDGRAALVLAEAAERSLRTGGRVPLPPDHIVT